MPEMINLTINGKAVTAPEGTTILAAAKDNGVYIPTLCYDDALEPYGACGLCVVEAQGMPKLLRACSSKISEGMVIDTESPRVIKARKAALELIMSAHDGDCKAPCSLACPAGTDCQGYVGLIANGEFDAALKLIKDKIALPASIGRICPHPCEKACRRALVDKPINIAQLKAFAADVDRRMPESYKPNTAQPTGKTVSIIGGGPGGLNAAYFLSIAGHSVKVYDMMPKMGGMLRYGIPEYRLPKEILDSEIKMIESLGVEMINNVKVGVDITFEEIKKSSDAVILAPGAWKSAPMRVKGEELNGVYGGIDFLRAVIMGNAPDIGQRVAVCGGGNTAMDACRTAVRLGAKEVYVIYRRTKAEMPADELEIEEAEEEGVIYKFLTNPAEIIGKDGKVSSMKLQIMELGEPDEGGRRKPVPVEGKFEEIKLDSVIMAIGQKLDPLSAMGVEMTNRGTILADEETFLTSEDAVFAIGDASNKGASIAIEAVGEGERAAKAVDAYLKGEPMKTRKTYLSKREVTADMLAHKEKLPRVMPAQLTAEERKDNFKEVCKGYTEQQAKEEASRCLECGCREYFKCKLLNAARLYDIEPERFKGKMPQKYNADSNEFIERNTAKCILCGLCVRSCSEVMHIDAIGLLGRGFTTDISTAFSLPLDKTNCNGCGLCVSLCPTGALTERSALKKQVPLDEDYKTAKRTVGSKECEFTLTYYNGRLIRVIPADDAARTCGLSRGEMFKLFSE